MKIIEIKRNGLFSECVSKFEIENSNLNVNASEERESIDRHLCCEQLRCDFRRRFEIVYLLLNYMSLAVFNQFIDDSVFLKCNAISQNL